MVLAVSDVADGSSQTSNIHFIAYLGSEPNVCDIQRLPMYKMTLEGLIFSSFADHILFSMFGIAISVYSLYIEIRKEKDKNYRAACDFNEHMSCSRVLTSKYSKGFGLVEILFGKEHVLNMPNCILGIIFYTMQLLLGLFNHYWATKLLFFSSIVSCFGSLYLAYILFAVLHDFCLVCVTTYGVNATLMYLNYQAHYYHN